MYVAIQMNPIQARCEPATPANVKDRQSPQFPELFEYPLYAKNYDTIGGYCFDNTIKDFISDSIFDPSCSEQELINQINYLIDVKHIAVFPFVFHTNLGVNPRGDGSDVHPLFDPWWFREEYKDKLFNVVVYLLVRTDYHLFPQEDSLFEYLNKVNYVPQSDEEAYKLCVAYGTIAENNELIEENHLKDCYINREKYVHVPAWIQSFYPAATKYFLSLVGQTSAYTLIADDILQMILREYLFMRPSNKSMFDICVVQ